MTHPLNSNVLYSLQLSSFHFHNNLPVKIPSTQSKFILNNCNLQAFTSRIVCFAFCWSSLRRDARHNPCDRPTINDETYNLALENNFNYSQRAHLIALLALNCKQPHSHRHRIVDNNKMQLTLSQNSLLQNGKRKSIQHSQTTFEWRMDSVSAIRIFHSCFGFD